jgi:hypothetical protein
VAHPCGFRKGELSALLSLIFPRTSSTSRWLTKLFYLQERPSAPRPIFCIADRAFFERIGVHVVELLARRARVVTLINRRSNGLSGRTILVLCALRYSFDNSLLPCYFRCVVRDGWTVVYRSQKTRPIRQATSTRFRVHLVSADSNQLKTL